MTLSILICSVQRRLSRFSLLARHLEQQAHNKAVEILWLGDNKTMSVGEKRNKLLSLAKGDYVCFVDDDDWVTDDYIEMLLEGTRAGTDVVCFNALYSNSATGVEQTVYFDMGNLNVNEKGKRLRMPNHLCPVKRSIAIKTGFIQANFGEDANYGLRLRNEHRINSQYKINKVIYYYNFDPDKSETWKYSPQAKALSPTPALPVREGDSIIQGKDYGFPLLGGLRGALVIMDVIMVSNSTHSLMGRVGEGLELTQNAINSIAADNVNVIVMEKAERVRYAHAEMFAQQEPFNYNQCLNNGAVMGNAPYICFTNNDVVFPANFVADVTGAMDEQGLDVASVKDQFGRTHTDNISGFCFVMRRHAYHQLGRFAEDYNFWCADNVVWEQIKQHNLKHGWLNVKVWHGVSTTLKKLDTATRESYTQACVKQFNRDYNKNVLGLGQ